MTANCTFISSASYYDEDLKKTFLSLKGRYYDHYNRNCRIVVPHSDIAICVLPGDKFEIAGDYKQDKGVIYVDSISNHITPFLKFDTHVQGKDEARAVLSAVPMSFRYFDLPDPTQGKHCTAKRYSAALKWLESWCGNNPGYIRDCLASISDVIEEEVSKALDMKICARTADKESLSAEIFSRKTTKEIPLAVFRLFRKRVRNDIERFKIFNNVYDMPSWYVAAFVLYLYTISEVREAESQLMQGGINASVRHSYLSNFSLLSRNIIYDHPSFIECLYKKSLDSSNHDIEFTIADLRAIEIASKAEKPEDISIAKSSGWRADVPAETETDIPALPAEEATLTKLFEIPALQEQTAFRQETFSMSGYYKESRLQHLLGLDGKAGLDIECRYTYSDKEVVENALRINAACIVASSHRHKKRIEATLSKYGNASGITIMGAAEFVNSEVLSFKNYIIAETGLLSKDLLLGVLEKIAVEGKSKVLLFADPYSLVAGEEPSILLMRFPIIDEKGAMIGHLTGSTMGVVKSAA